MESTVLTDDANGETREAVAPSDGTETPRYTVHGYVEDVES
jgi:hypothetical protein